MQNTNEIKLAAVVSISLSGTSGKKKTLTRIKKKEEILRPYIVRKGTIQENKTILVILHLTYI